MPSRTLPLVLAGLGLGACVSNSTHLAALDQVRRSTQEQSRAQCDKEKAALRARRDTDVSRLEQEKQKLSAALAAARQQGADLGFKDNWELSSARALVVTRFLIENGVPPGNLAAAGYGKHDPVRSNRSRRGRRLNRRIELILVPDLSELPQLPPQKPS